MFDQMVRCLNATKGAGSITQLRWAAQEENNRWYDIDNPAWRRNPRALMRTNKARRPVVALRLSDQKVRVFFSAVAAARALGASIGMVHQHIFNNVTPIDGLRMGYYHDNHVLVDTAEVFPKTCPLIATDEGGSIRLAPSISALTKLILGTPGQIRHAMMTDTPFVKNEKVWKVRFATYEEIMLHDPTWQPIRSECFIPMEPLSYEQVFHGQGEAFLNTLNKRMILSQVQKLWNDRIEQMTTA